MSLCKIRCNSKTKTNRAYVYTNLFYYFGVLKPPVKYFLGISSLTISVHLWIYKPRVKFLSRSKARSERFALGSSSGPKRRNIEQILSTRVPREEKKRRPRSRSVLILEESHEYCFRVHGKLCDTWKQHSVSWPWRYISFFILQRRQTRKSNEIEHKEYNQHVVQRHRISLRVIFLTFSDTDIEIPRMSLFRAIDRRINFYR